MKTWFKRGAAGVLAAGGVAAADVLPSSQPPGGLTPSITPQMVLLTFDDSVTSASYVRVQQALTNLFNPNGQAIRATFFVSMDGSYDPSAIRRLYDAGHEIAVHTMSHATGTNSSLVRWRQEIAGERRTLERLCGISQEEIVGFRAPFLMPNDATYQVLSERGFLYDSSFAEDVGVNSTASTNMLWPYTLDHGLAQAAPAGRAPAAGYPGLFELPLWVQFTNEVACTTMDPPDALSSAEAVALWQSNFMARYCGNRAPYGIFLHATSGSQWLGETPLLNERVDALRTFIAWALSQPDTWFVTCRDVAGFMLDPADVDEAYDHPSFLMPEREPYPEADVTRCAYPGSHTLSVCGSCPPAAPSFTNAYLGLVPETGGAINFSVVSQSANYVWCEMTLSNNLPNRAFDWSFAFSVTGGTVAGLYDAVWTQYGERLVANAKKYNRQLAANGAVSLAFRVTRTGGPVVFSEETTSLSMLGQLPLRVGIHPDEGSDGWELSWNDDAHVYDVEATSSLKPPQVWTPVTNGISRPEWVVPHDASGGARFFRVKGTVY